MRSFLRIIKLFLQKIWIPVLVVAIVLAAGFSSVEIYRDEVKKNAPADVTYKESKALNLSATAIDTLNPILSRCEDMYHITKLLYNSLFDYDETLSIVPELVDTYEVNTERGRVVMTLREDVKWHDGSDLTARDVQFTVSAIVAAGEDSPYYDSASKIYSVNLRGTRELEIYFRNAYDASLDDLTFPILPAAQYASPAALAQARDDFHPVGTGQYCYRSYDPLRQLRLKVNEDYFGPVAEKRIDIMLVPEKELAANMLQIDAVTCYLDASPTRKSIVQDHSFNMYEVPSNEVEFLVFRPSGKMLREKAGRQAVAYAIDERNVLENGYMGNGILCDTIYYPGFLGVEEESGGTYAYDVEAAKQKLRSLGYADVDNDGMLEDEDGEDIDLSLLVNRDNAMRLAAARLIAQNLEAVGLRVTLKEQDWKDYRTSIKEGEYDILLTGYAMDEKYDLRSFFNRRSPWRYYNEGMFEQASALEKLHTPQEYRDTYGLLKNMLLDEMPYYSLCYKKLGLVGVSTFTADGLPTFFDHYRHCETWRWSYAVTADGEPATDGENVEISTS